MIYLYKCEKDELIFEVERDEPKPREVCPECGKFAPRKYTPPNVHYKGEGWTRRRHEERDQ